MKALRSITANLAPRTDPVGIRVVTWNIHCGQDGGPRWKRFNWSRRKAALAAALRDTDADVVCVQEARVEQVAFLESLLPTHRRAGVGRGGEMVGEHCAIFFSRDRFTLLDSGTFWLKEPCDVPGCGSLLGLSRICTWVRLRDGRRRPLSARLQHPLLPDRGAAPPRRSTDSRPDGHRRPDGWRRPVRRFQRPSHSGKPAGFQRGRAGG